MLDDITIARALHVLSVVHWFGGVSFVTLIILPLVRVTGNAGQAVALFSAVERRFSRQVRISIPLAGATGLWMTWRMDLWERFVDPAYWWMSAMLVLWLVFMAVVFVVEPRKHARIEERARQAPAATFGKIARVHLVLLALAVLTILGAVAGSHGLNLF